MPSHREGGIYAASIWGERLGAQAERHARRHVRIMQLMSVVIVGALAMVVLTLFAAAERAAPWNLYAAYAITTLICVWTMGVTWWSSVEYWRMKETLGDQYGLARSEWRRLNMTSPERFDESLAGIVEARRQGTVYRPGWRSHLAWLPASAGAWEAALGVEGMRRRDRYLVVLGVWFLVTPLVVSGQVVAVTAVGFDRMVDTSGPWLLLADLVILVVLVVWTRSRRRALHRAVAEHHALSPEAARRLEWGSPAAFERSLADARADPLPDQPGRA